MSGAPDELVVSLAKSLGDLKRKLESARAVSENVLHENKLADDLDNDARLKCEEQIVAAERALSLLKSKLVADNKSRELAKAARLRKADTACKLVAELQEQRNLLEPKLAAAKQAAEAEARQKEAASAGAAAASDSEDDVLATLKLQFKLIDTAANRRAKPVDVHVELRRKHLNSDTPFVIGRAGAGMCTDPTTSMELPARLMSGEHFALSLAKKRAAGDLKVVVKNLGSNHTLVGTQSMKLRKAYSLSTGTVLFVDGCCELKVTSLEFSHSQPSPSKRPRVQDKEEIDSSEVSSTEAILRMHQLSGSTHNRRSHVFIFSHDSRDQFFATPLVVGSGSDATNAIKALTAAARSRQEPSPQHRDVNLLTIHHDPNVPVVLAEISLRQENPHSSYGLYIRAATPQAENIARVGETCVGNSWIELHGGDELSFSGFTILKVTAIDFTFGSGTDLSSPAQQRVPPTASRGAPAPGIAVSTLSPKAPSAPSGTQAPFDWEGTANRVRAQSTAATSAKTRSVQKPSPSLQPSPAHHAAVDDATSRELSGLYQTMGLGGKTANVSQSSPPSTVDDGAFSSFSKEAPVHNAAALGPTPIPGAANVDDSENNIHDPATTNRKRKAPTTPDFRGARGTMSVVKHISSQRDSTVPSTRARSPRLTIKRRYTDYQFCADQQEEQQGHRTGSSPRARSGLSPRGRSGLSPRASSPYAATYGQRYGRTPLSPYARKVSDSWSRLQGYDSDEQGTLHPRRRPDYPQDETTAASTPANRRGGLSFHSPKVPTPGNKDVSAPIAQRAAREASPQVGSQQGTESPAVANVVSRETLAIRAKAQETAAKVASPGRTSTAALQHADGRLVVYMYQVTKQGKRRKNGGLDVEIVLDSSSPATRVCVLGRADEGETPGVVTECEGKQRVSFACDNMSRWHAEIFLTRTGDGDWAVHVRDCDSTNGTKLNKKTLEPTKSGQGVPLREACRLTLGPFALKVASIHDPSQALKASPSPQQGRPSSSGAVGHSTRRPQAQLQSEATGTNDAIVILLWRFRGNLLSQLKSKIQALGGTVVDEDAITTDLHRVTHVVYRQRTVMLLKAAVYGKHIVAGADWINACYHQRRWLPLSKGVGQISSRLQGGGTQYYFVRWVTNPLQGCTIAVTNESMEKLRSNPSHLKSLKTLAQISQATAIVVRKSTGPDGLRQLFSMGHDISKEPSAQFPLGAEIDAGFLLDTRTIPYSRDELPSCITLDFPGLVDFLVGPNPIVQRERSNTVSPQNTTLSNYEMHRQRNIRNNKAELRRIEAASAN